MFVVLSICLLWTAVPPSTNPDSKINREFLDVAIPVINIERAETGRVWFHCDDDKLQLLDSIPARSLRLVALKSTEISPLRLDKQSSHPNTESTVVESLCHNWKTLYASLNAWAMCGNIHPRPDESPTFSLTCQKWDTFVDPTISTSGLANEMAKALSRKFGWSRVRKSQRASYRFHALLYDSQVILELVTFERPLRVDELPKPGFKRIESFAVVKTADIQPDEFVLDPMCGRATFLVEAATLWPSARYQGVDSSDDQLQNAKENCRAAHVPIFLVEGDACHLAHLPDASVDKIVTCPPFGRQFKKESTFLYNDLLKEWNRVLKVSGRMVILIDVSNSEALTDAVQNAGCGVEFQRLPFRLGKIQTTILIITKKKRKKPFPVGTFEWEHGEQTGRALWTSLREKALPSLKPYTLSQLLRQSQTIP